MIRSALLAESGERDAARLAGILNKLANGSAALRARATAALVPGLKTMLAQMSASLQASRVTIATMPQDMVRDWVAKDGTARIQVSPSDTSGSNRSLNIFSKAVLKVVPDATGAPISIRESGTTIVTAFEEAGALSFVVITVLLLAVLRKGRDVMLTIIPLLLTGLLTMATAVVIGLQLNFQRHRPAAAVQHRRAFNIYFVMARPDIPTCCNPA